VSRTEPTTQSREVTRPFCTVAANPERNQGQVPHICGVDTVMSSTIAYATVDPLADFGSQAGRDRVVDAVRLALLNGDPAEPPDSRRTLANLRWPLGADDEL
jgi:hypothetical protein